MRSEIVNYDYDNQVICEHCDILTSTWLKITSHKNKAYRQYWYSRSCYSCLHMCINCHGLYASIRRCNKPFVLEELED